MPPSEKFCDAVPEELVETLLATSCRRRQITGLDVRLAPKNVKALAENATPKASLFRRSSQNHAIHIGILAGSLSGNFNVQAIRFLVGLNLFVRSEQSHRLDFLVSQRCRTERMDHCLSIGRPTEFNRVEVASFCSKAEVFL